MSEPTAAAPQGVPSRARDLPAPVRGRVVALTADVLPDLTALPAPLRSVAGFTPARRVRVGERAILDALEDEEFREQAGRQIAAHPADQPSPAEAAARAWIGRADDTAELLARAAAPQPAPDPELTRTLARLRTKLDEAEAQSQAEREQHQEAVARLKADTAGLRRKLTAARAAEQETRDELAALAAEADRLRTGLAEAEATVRRTQEQLARAQEEARAGRSDRRAERDELTVRTRLLLDALVDTAAGLRRELALPAVTGNPADRLEAELNQAGSGGEGSRATSAAGALGPASPALLDQLLALPRARLIVDGYNVTMAAWPDASLERQRQRLLSGVAAIVARTGAETTVVFDAHTAPARPLVAAPRGVRVIFTPSGVLADDVIRDLVAVEPAGRAVVVVTSDQEVVSDVRRAGARTVSSAALVGLLNRAG